MPLHFTDKIGARCSFLKACAKSIRPGLRIQLRVTPPLPGTVKLHGTIRWHGTAENEKLPLASVCEVHHLSSPPSAPGYDGARKRVAIGRLS
jgi:hypothetical protein